MSRKFMVLFMLATLVGCSSMSHNDRQRSEAIADARAKLSMGRCSMALARQVVDVKEPALEQETAYLCLQQGDLEAVKVLLSDYDSRHVDPPFPDYSAYLLALTDFVRFESSAGDAQQRLALGRQAHNHMARFVRAYPESSYRHEIAPRLEQLHEGMARAEYQLAQSAIEANDIESGKSRLNYVVKTYPRSAAAKDAARWLEHDRR